MKFKPSRISVKRPKRLIIIIVSAVLLLSVAVYGVFSYLHWQKYDQDTQKAASSLKTAMTDAFNSEKTQVTPSAQIDKVVSDFEKTYGSTPCNVSVWYNWQTVLPPLKTAQDTCKQRFLAAINTIRALKPLSEFLKDAQKAADLITTTVEATKSPTDYTAAASTWSTLAESKEMSDSVGFQPVRMKITSLSDAVSTAFTKLATATKDENKAAFDQATTDLAAAYKQIDDVKTTAASIQTTYINDVIKLYEKL